MKFNEKIVFEIFKIILRITLCSDNLLTYTPLSHARALTQKFTCAYIREII
jgi:hypothetical protein